ncbi:T9SS type A sorting domain-containing protein [Fluviicola chungangensis]|uniref:T9SS type A sorting domain-containing protein n=1 Tax=Fluviicola chungangensis TaxID=2597671 RepID=A0A556N6L6_9FLAO|nr:T9SS type A sorting domain-containing protein [Fluviicola chungangensis]TSJ47713.1 T9SS type A sorting domain-containing protein [Fluviicola chungangensis]
MKKILLALLGCSSIFAMNASAQHLDSTFNTNGYLPYLGPNSNSEGNLGGGMASAIQADGKIVTVLRRDPNTSDLMMHVYRYLSNGMPDPAFGTNGAAEIYCGQDSRGYDVKIQSDGKIVFIGESKYCINGVCGAKQFIMMRLKTNGSLDSTFGVNGHLLTNHVFGTTGTYSIPKSLHILPNGKFMVGGIGPGGKPAIVRLNTDGFPDNTYGTNGVFSLTNVPRSRFVDMAIGPNGETYGLLRIDSWNSTTYAYDSANYTDNTLFKLDPNGTPDLNFGTNGFFSFGTDNTDEAASILYSTTGKLLVAGYNMPVNNYYSSGYGRLNKGFVAFVNTTGALDNSIPNGFVNFDFAQDSATFFSKIIEKGPNEFLICGFTSDYVSGNYQNKGLIVSMNAQGQLNNAFNGNGYLIFDHGMVGSSGWNGKLANFMDIDLTSNLDIILTGYRNPIAGATKESIYILKLTFGTDSNLAVGKFSEEQAFSAYPNPVSNGHFLVNSNESASIQLISLDGKVLYENSVSEGISDITLVSAYKGVAILKVQTPDGKVGTYKLLFE